MKRKRWVVLSIFLCVLIVSGISYFSQEETTETLGERTLTIGTRGWDVRQLQRRLDNLGIYPGPVDGIYGPRTAAAVRRFQRSRGLVVDGVAGPRTISALLNANAARPAVAGNWSAVRNQDDVRLLARIIHGEARGEPYIGQVAIAAVVLNRVEHPSFPNTIPGVIFQPGAFSAVSDGQIWLTPDASAKRAATDALNGWDPTGGALYYWNPATATSSWIWSRSIWFKIGKHVFGR
ncbi:MAG: N-acetylmuramoyl-L-alanine amidase [Clostridia bacterium]|nr:N-acetylmuramoyl-L-alanine amidase [Clostridia bacterium]